MQRHAAPNNSDATPIIVASRLSPWEIPGRGYMSSRHLEQASGALTQQRRTGSDTGIADSRAIGSRWMEERRLRV